jgi:hypothetical protein
LGKLERLKYDMDKEKRIDTESKAELRLERKLHRSLQWLQT